MNNLEILLIGNPILNLLSYIFVVLLMFNLLKVNYFNPIVAVFLKVYEPISKILFLFQNQIINIIIISVIIKFVSLFVFFLGEQKEILTLFGLAVGQIFIVSLRVIFFAVIGGVIISWVSPNSSNPFLQLIEEMSYKALSPIRKHIPSAGGLDFSPLFILILINLVESFLNGMLNPIV